MYRPSTRRALLRKDAAGAPLPRRAAPTQVKAGLAFLVLSLLTALSLAIAPAQAKNLFAIEQAHNLFVANQSTNTIREFSPTGADLGDFATTGLN